MSQYRVVDNADGWSIYTMPGDGSDGRFVSFFSNKEWTRPQIEQICEVLNNQRRYLR